MAGEDDLALDSTWSVVELCAGRGEYSSRMTEVARFNSGLWRWLSNYPKIEDAHSTGTHCKQLVRRSQDGGERRVTLEALTVFRVGIAPEWEDPLNKAGYEVRLKFDRSAWPEQRHPIWEEVLLLVTGGTLPGAAAVNGLRYVDKGKGKHRLEVWTRSEPSEELVQALRGAFTRVVGETCPKLEVVRHADFVVQ